MGIFGNCPEDELKHRDPPGSWGCHSVAYLCLRGQPKPVDVMDKTTEVTGRQEKGDQLTILGAQGLRWSCALQVLFLLWTPQLGSVGSCYPRDANG